MSHEENANAESWSEQCPFFGRRRLDFAWKVLVGPVRDPCFRSRQALFIRSMSAEKREMNVWNQLHAFWLGTGKQWPHASSWAVLKTKASSTQIKIYLGTDWNRTVIAWHHKLRINLCDTAKNKTCKRIWIHREQDNHRSKALRERTRSVYPRRRRLAPRREHVAKVNLQGNMEFVFVFVCAHGWWATAWTNDTSAGCIENVTFRELARMLDAKSV